MAVIPSVVDDWVLRGMPRSPHTRSCHCQAANMVALVACGNVQLDTQLPRTAPRSTDLPTRLPAPDYLSRLLTPVCVLRTTASSLCVLRLLALLLYRCAANITAVLLQTVVVSYRFGLCPFLTCA